MPGSAWKSTELADLLHAYRKAVALDQIALSLNRPIEEVRLKISELVAAQAAKRTHATSRDLRARPVSAHLKQAPAPQEETTVAHTEATLSETELTDVNLAFARFYFVYAIVNQQGLVYIGYSQNVWHRVAQHNLDLGATHTSARGPWFPFAIACFASERDARAAEADFRNNFSRFISRTSLSLRTVLAQLGFAEGLNTVQLAQ